MIPDTQVKPGVPLDHLEWIGQYIVDKQPDVIVHIGDHYDMESLSSWDKGKKSFEGRRYQADIEAGNKGLEVLEAPIDAFNDRQRLNRKKQYLPQKHWTLGNHEHRADRCAEDFAEFDGIIGTQQMRDFWEDRQWNCHDYQNVIEIDGVWYTHFVANPMSGRPLGGMAETRLKTVGNSFSMGHQQLLAYAVRYVGPRSQHALIAGSCYLHDENYKGPRTQDSMMSGNHHWRGIIMKHEVRHGSYDPMFVSLDYLCRRYTGADSLGEYLGVTYPWLNQEEAMVA